MIDESQKTQLKLLDNQLKDKLILTPEYRKQLKKINKYITINNQEFKIEDLLYFNRNNNNNEKYNSHHDTNQTQDNETANTTITDNNANHINHNSKEPNKPSTKAKKNITDNNNYNSESNNQTQYQQTNTPQKYPISQENNQKLLIKKDEIFKLCWYTTHVKTRFAQEPVHLKWQERTMNDENPLVFILWSRQIWKSYSESPKIILESFEFNKTIMVCAFQKETTNRIRDYILRLTEKFPYHKNEPMFDHNKMESYIENTLTKSKIFFRSLEGEADRIRWFTVDYIHVDEWMLVPWEVYEEILLPTMDTTWGKMRVLLTAKKRNWAYEKIMQIKQWLIEWSVHTITIDDNPLISPERRRQIEAQKHLPHIRREYYCEFVTDNESNIQVPRSQFFPDLSKWLLSIWYDPARLKDRAWYSIIHVNEWLCTIIESWEIPAQYKNTYEFQAKYFQEVLFPKYPTLKIHFAIDVTWQWDWASEIFKKQNILHTKVRYTSSNSVNKTWNYHKVGKSVLIERFMDFCQEWIMKIYPYTNSLLIEELSHISFVHNNFGNAGIKSSFFDDITNATFIACYNIVANNLLSRSNYAKQEQNNIYNWLMQYNNYHQKWSNKILW